MTAMFLEMVAPILLKIITVVAGVLGLASAFRDTFLKYRGRSDLAKAVNRTDAEKATRLIGLKKVDEAADVLRKYVGELPENERANVESALSQPSVTGRAGYILNVSLANRASASRASAAD